MIRLFVLALRYVLWHRLRSLLLILGIALAVYLPIATNWSIAMMQTQLTKRAAATPLVVGAKGSRFDLVFQALYFRAVATESIRFADFETANASGYARIIPVHFRHTASGFPIVATTLEYGDFRGFEFAAGGNLSFLGDCVIGDTVARRLGLSPGDRLVSDNQDIFRIAGHYPLNMRVVGMLAPTGTPDDEAVFVELRTGWILDGYIHGHEDLSTDVSSQYLLSEQDGVLRANRALPTYTTITEDNIDTFHLHGEEGDLPLTALIALPHSERDSALFRGRYASSQSALQALVSSEVIDDIINDILRVKRLLDIAAFLIVVTTLLFLTLTVLFSLKVRAAEIATLQRLGASRTTIGAMILIEYLILVFGAFLVAILLSVITQPLLNQLIETILVRS